jgi:hypothetical protein
MLITDQVAIAPCTDCVQVRRATLRLKVVWRKLAALPPRRATTNAFCAKQPLDTVVHSIS